MANPEHLAILKEGVDAWNEWRARNVGTIPDLVEADLAGISLVRANLREVDLRGANLQGAQLSDSYILAANLTGANLAGAWLEGVCLAEGNLTGVALKGARLFNADLYRTVLTGADITKASLMHANLSGAKLEAANLCGVDLRYCIVIRADLTRANLTGAKLYGTARDDWVVDGVQCGYVFWNEDGEIRSPKDRDFAPGEFEQLYRSLPIIEYVFRNVMTPLDPLIMDRVVQAIREQNPEYDIQIDSISARGLAPSIRFTVQREEHKEPALAEVTKVYEAKVHELAGRLDEARSFIQRLIDRPNTVYIENSTGPLAIGGSTINIDQHVEYVTNLRDAVAALPEDSPVFGKKAKKAALDIIGGALKDVAKGKVKDAAEQIIELGKDLGPVIVQTVAYGFFKSCLG